MTGLFYVYMSKTNSEILAPCGEFNSVIYAVNAGADAVYLGGELFSARAFATNLSTNEIIEAIHYAHLNNCKVYLTLNILLKNQEIETAIAMIEPLYENGLDAIIIQDLGLLNILSNHFPSLEVHISTQNSIMSSFGVRFFKNLKDKNVTRIVPARELSLNEIKNLKKEGLEIECFVHGSMCYSYSGKCLFSSIAGGRSGNRGRCAGPCRKAYDVLDSKGNLIKSKIYPISMKDMCSILDNEGFTGLIDNEIDSFKIEGRMKAAEYSAGVAAIYKKYSDEYKNKGNYNLNKADKKTLSNLYIRTDILPGYLNKHNGKDMISIDSPAYNSVDNNTVAAIKDKYGEIIKKAVSIQVSVFNGEAITANLTFEDINVFATGELALVANNNPATVESIKKQMVKLGGTYFYCDDCTVYTDGKSFVPVSMLNDLRRNLINNLMDELFVKRFDTISKNSADKKYLNDFENSNIQQARFIVAVSNYSQLKTASNYDYAFEYIADIFSDIFDHDLSFLGEKTIYLRLPAIIRENKIEAINKRLTYIINNYNISGVYINSIDGLSLIIENNYFDKDKCFADSGLYIFNDYAADFISQYVNEYTVSYEHNEKEIKHYESKIPRQLVVYGYIPLMYSANCIGKTIKSCDINTDRFILRDEARRNFTAVMNHDLCYNTIYNYLPLNLYGKMDGISKDSYSAYRIEFTIENDNEVKEVLNTFAGSDNYNKNLNNRNNNHTLGHYCRGVD